MAISLSSAAMDFSVLRGPGPGDRQAGWRRGSHERKIGAGGTRLVYFIIGESCPTRYPYVRSKGPSLRPDHDGARARWWAEVKDGPQGHRRRRRPASLRSAHHRATLGWSGSDDWPAWWGSRSKAEFSRPCARSNNLVFGPAHGRRP